MAIARAPYYDPAKDRWYVDKDPNNKWFYVADVSAELTLNNTTAISCIAVSDARMTVISGPTVQGSLIVFQVTGPTPKTTELDDAFVTLRTTCANTEQFDKTIWFKPVED